MSRTEAAIRRAGAAVALAAACALMRVPEPEAHRHAVLALHAAFLLGCAAVQLAPAHRAVAGLACRAAAEAARRGMALGASPAWLRWVSFAGVLLYALYVAGDVRTEAAAAAEAPVEKFKDLLFFLLFLAAVWAIYLSVITGRVAPQPRPEEEEEELDGGEVDAMAPRPARVLVDSMV